MFSVSSKAQSFPVQRPYQNHKLRINSNYYMHLIKRYYEMFLIWTAWFNTQQVFLYQNTAHQGADCLASLIIAFEFIWTNVKKQHQWDLFWSYNQSWGLHSNCYLFCCSTAAYRNSNAKKVISPFIFGIFLINVMVINNKKTDNGGEWWDVETEGTFVLFF